MKTHGRILTFINARFVSAPFTSSPGVAECFCYIWYLRETSSMMLP
jgi:hypothetical protein